MAFDIKIITPKGVYLEDRVDSLTVKFVSGYRTILTGHYPLVGSLDIAPMHMMKGNNTLYYSLNGGAISVEKERVVLVVNSIEGKNEIDIDRANASKERAEKRLAIKDQEIDLKRASISLAKALSRIKTYNS